MKAFGMSIVSSPNATTLRGSSNCFWSNLRRIGFGALWGGSIEERLLKTPPQDEAATGRQCTKRLSTLEVSFSVDVVITIYQEQ